jgi:hypothetical protein
LKRGWTTSSPGITRPSRDASPVLIQRTLELIQRSRKAGTDILMAEIIHSCSWTLTGLDVEVIWNGGGHKTYGDAEFERYKKELQKQGFIVKNGNIYAPVMDDDGNVVGRRRIGTYASDCLHCEQFVSTNRARPERRHSESNWIRRCNRSTHCWDRGWCRRLDDARRRRNQGHQHRSEAFT